jgi:hypothetical protein
MVVSNTDCVVFLFCFVLFFFVLPVSLTCQICIAPLVFSKVFILKKNTFFSKTFYFRYSNVRREFDFYFPPSPTRHFPDLTMSSTSGCLIRNRNCLPFGNTFVRLRFLERSVLLLFWVFGVVFFYFVCLCAKVDFVSILPIFDCPCGSL